LRKSLFFLITRIPSVDMLLPFPASLTSAAQKARTKKPFLLNSLGENKDRVQNRVCLLRPTRFERMAAMI
jgi:hypothetical protein